ncbi:fungal specific transcription factor domain-containing protein [Fusarium austroafricanum]|uniref:Fungal specific transcription factor domain-containing protein n=1 Tax=Fusarium austroafricanum TaxID=2364996 RepID=A0A8H4KX65_9HYPO|nr:fungal specific transcription factor domain-containing protein [Fusarium austroafricanum]
MAKRTAAIISVDFEEFILNHKLETACQELKTGETRSQQDYEHQFPIPYGSSQPNVIADQYSLEDLNRAIYLIYTFQNRYGKFWSGYYDPAWKEVEMEAERPDLLLDTYVQDQLDAGNYYLDEEEVLHDDPERAEAILKLPSLTGLDFIDFADRLVSDAAGVNPKRLREKAQALDADVGARTLLSVVSLQIFNALHQPRRRKVRCDVAFGGSPCLNCRLDEVHCEVKGREFKHICVETSKEATEKTDTTFAPPICGEIWLQDGMLPAKDEPSLGGYTFSSSNSPPCDRNNQQNEPPDSSSADERAWLKPTDDHLAFISDPDLSHLSPDDVSYLRQQGCFNVPPKHILDEIVREYFLHVHPMLPFMDERAFWEKYSCVEGQSTNKLSLFLIQAMLFASCSFVSEFVTKELGFECPRFAAAAFYRRAKLLYDLETEPFAFDLARGALLLTFWPISFGTGHPTPNSVWLTRAIKHAECLRANHVWHSVEHAGRSSNTASLKRLWWCCILRDRSISLGLRRSVQISGQYPLPEDEDFSSEFDGSLVYTSRIKSQLFRIFRRLIALCNIVTDLLQLAARYHNVSHRLTNIRADDRTTLSRCREDLSSWFSATGEDFLQWGHESELRHESIIVYTNFVYIHYYTAKLLLHHQKLMFDVSLSGLTEHLPSALVGIDHEVQSATFRFIDHLSEPARLGLARFLPVSVAAFAAVPITMHVFEAKLSSSAMLSDQVAGNQRRLRTLIEVFKAYHHRFEGIEPLSFLIRQTVNSVESGLTTQWRGCLRSWSDIITYRPYQYLSCTAEMGRSLRSSQAPKDYSIPSGWPAVIEDCCPTETGLSWSVSDIVTNSEGLETD